MEEKILIQAISPYSIKDKETGELKEGVSIFYLSQSTCLDGSNNGKLGYFPCKETFPISFIDKLKNGVGYYTSVLGLKSVNTKSGYKTMTTISDLKFIEKFTIK